MNTKQGWIVTKRIKKSGKWIEPLPGMDRVEAWFANRRQAREFHRLTREACPSGSFVLRRAAR